MSTEQEQLEAAIAALSAQRATLGDAIVDLAVAPLLARLAAVAPTLAEASDQTLRQVTILCLDVVGSTALSQHLDPEEIHALMDGTLERCTEIVTAQRGKVLQYAGDSLLAVFGADLAQEDDAERAVRAGLGLVEQGRAQGATVRRLYGYDGFNVRVGIHTGSVLLGGGLDAEGRVRGLAVQIASHMEKTAPAGALRISRDTYRHVRGLFDVEDQPPLPMKGIDQPLATYLVQRASPRAFRVRGSGGAGSDGIAGEIGMVGRDAELDQLGRAVDAAREERVLRMVSVVADAGLGKSRLLVEVEARLGASDRPVRLFHGRAQRHGLNVAYGVIRDMLAWHCEIVDSDGPDVAGAKLAQRFGQAFGERAAEQSALVGQLIGLDYSADAHIAGIVHDGQQIRARAFHAVAEYLRMQCAPDGSLVVLLLDDLHWADEGSLDLIEFLASAGRDLPLVLGCFGRPALLERRPTWGEAIPGTTRIVLEPLPAEGSEHLVDALLSRLVDPPPELKALILQNAEGNPFHMEELLGMLIDDGVIVATPEGWRVDRARLTAVKVPSTLTAVLQARLDALPPREKLALQRDSVIGHVFWDDALQRIAPDSVDLLEQLARRELISRREGSAFAGVREYAFKHHLLHQVTYDTVLKGPRRALHRLTADWLVSITGERVGEHLGLIADHYERAGDAVHAVEFLRRAGEAAYGAAAFGAGIDYVERALALCPERDVRMRYDLLSNRFNLHGAVGRRKDQLVDVAVLAELADALDDDRCRAEAARSHALVLLVTGRYEESIVAADRALALAAAVGDVVITLGAMLDRSQSQIYLGDEGAARASLEEMLPMAQASGKAHLEVTVANRLHTLAKNRGDFGPARTYLEHALAAARASGHRRFEGALMSNLGGFESRLGNYEKGRALIQAGLDISRAIGDRGSVPYAMHALSEVLFGQGEPAVALPLLLEARALAAEVSDRGAEAECALMIGECHAALGHVAEAETAFGEHEAWASSAAVEPAAQETAPKRALLALRQGDVAGARACVDRIVAWIDTRSGPVHREDLERYFACHRVLAETGDARADEFLERARELLMLQAAALADDERRVYLENVHLHREIDVAWRARRMQSGLAA